MFISSGSEIKPRGILKLVYPFWSFVSLHLWTDIVDISILYECRFCYQAHEKGNRKLLIGP